MRTVSCAEAAEGLRFGVDVDPGDQALAEGRCTVVRHPKARLFVVDSHKDRCHHQLSLYRSS